MRLALNLEQLLQHPPGGIGRYTAELARLLPRLPPDDEGRVEVAGFVARHERATVAAALRAFALDDLDPVVLPLPRPLLYDLWNRVGRPSVQTLSRRLHGVDVVHAPSVAVPPPGGAALVVTVHDAAVVLHPETYPRRGVRFHSAGFAAAAARADLVIAPTAAAADEIVGATPIPRDRIRVVPHGVDATPATPEEVAAMRDALRIGPGPYVLWIGTLEPRKNLPLLVEAYARAVRDAGIPHRLVLAGPRGWLDAEDVVRRAARALGDRIVLTGPVDEARLRPLYRGAALLCLPSLHEGFGLPALEAMGQGTAVLAADIAVLREVAGPAARYADPRDVGAWTGALVALAGDEPARAALGAAGRARVEGRTWDRAAAATRVVYVEALDRHRARRRRA